MNPLQIEFELKCDVQHAFDIFTRDISLWWPKTHSVSKDPELRVTLEPFVGGRIFERTAVGQEHDWGEIVAWNPPTDLSYLWHLPVDRSQATRVDVAFHRQLDAITRVRISHSGWELFGPEGETRRTRNEKGWAGVVPLYRAEAEGSRH